MNAGAPIPFPDEFNAAAYFIDRHVQEERSDKIAIECEGLCVTYRQLYEGVNRVGNGLRKLGVRIEERVFLLLLDTPEFAAIFFGAIKIGAIPVQSSVLPSRTIPPSAGPGVAATMPTSGARRRRCSTASRRWAAPPGR